MLAVIAAHKLISTIVAVLLIAGIAIYNGYADVSSYMPKNKPVAESKQTNGCHPTKSNPKFRCIPRDKHGNVVQLGGELPDEYVDLPNQRKEEQ